jgi:signal transduction histidine kinase
VQSSWTGPTRGVARPRTQRNPVGALLAGLPRVRREAAAGPLGAPALRMIDVAIECAVRIDRLVGDVLVLGQPARGGGCEHVDPHEGLESALRLLAHRVPATVEVRRHYEFQGRVRVEPAALSQVFVNLLDNALRAAGAPGVIEVTTRAEPTGALTVLIADSGPGVPAELAARIFDPFFTTRPVGDGTGLGLYLSRRLLDRVGGDLELVSMPGCGACFRVRVPLTAESAT